MRVQRKSEGKKYGNPPSHTQGVRNVAEFLDKHKKDKKWFFIDEYLVRFDPVWCKKDRCRTDYSHSYDLALMSVDKKSLGIDVVVFIEVDGFKHGTQKQKLNDQRAERYASYLGKRVIRLDKVECNGDLKERNEYLKKELDEFIK